MGELTHIQLNDIAQVWREMARSLSLYQTTHWAELSTVQHYDLNAYQNSLLTRAQDIDDRAFLLLNEPIEPILTTSLSLVHRAASTLNDAHEQMVALNIGALVVALAAGLSRNNTRSIQLALTELAQLTNTLPHPN